MSRMKPLSVEECADSELRGVSPHHRIQSWFFHGPRWGPKLFAP